MTREVQGRLGTVPQPENSTALTELSGRLGEIGLSTVRKFSQRDNDIEMIL